MGQVKEKPMDDRMNRHITKCALGIDLIVMASGREESHGDQTMIWKTQAKVCSTSQAVDFQLTG